MAEAINRCYAGQDVRGLGDDVLRRLRRIVPTDAAFFAAVDPMTLLFTSALSEEPLAPATALFLDNEFGREDVNKFSSLADSSVQVNTLDRATRGDRSASARYREIMAPLGLGDELRAALTTGRHCWGVLCLHRETSPYGFDAEDLAVVRRIAPHLAEGLRRAVTVTALEPAGDDYGPPGIIVLDSALAVVSMSPEARRWLSEFDDDRPRGSELPVAVHAVAARLARLEEPSTTTQAPPTVRLRNRAGRWFALHATYLRAPPEPQIGVVVEPAPAATVGPLLLSAYGLTDAQTRVAALVIRGHSTRQIVTELHISANTVQEHLTAVFDKLGIRSRRELVAAVVSGGP